MQSRHEQSILTQERVLRGPPVNLPESTAELCAWQFVQRRLAQHGHKTAQVEAATSLTSSFAEVRRRALCVCAWLQGLGLQRGTATVALQGPNSLHLAPLVLGAWKAGVACALINPTSTEREVAHACEISTPSLVIVWLPLRVSQHGEDSPELAAQLAAIFEQTSQSELEDEPCQGDGSHVALILSSSGSTGLPKGVALSHRNVVAALMSSCDYADSKTVALCVLPLFHAYGLLLMLMCLCEGARLVLLPKFSLSPFLDAAHTHQVCTLYLVPSLLALLERALEQEGGAARALASVRHVWTGAATVRAELQARFAALLPAHPRMCHSYGLTETTFVVLAARPARFDKPGSPGMLTRGMQCKVIDTVTGAALGPGQVGELLLQGPSVMLGYVGNSEATHEAIDTDGWLHTGDLGCYDAEGWFFLVDRIKEMIRYHAQQVSPSELEAVISCVPGVSEVAVVGVPDTVCGELPAALVVRHPGATVTEAEVQQHVASVLLQAAQRGSHFCVNLAKNSQWQNPPQKSSSALSTKGHLNLLRDMFKQTNSEQRSTSDIETVPAEKQDCQTPLLVTSGNTSSPHTCCHPESSATRPDCVAGASSISSTSNVYFYPQVPINDSFATSDESNVSYDSFDFIFFCYSKYSLACILLVMLIIYACAAYFKTNKYEPVM